MKSKLLMAVSALALTVGSAQAAEKNVTLKLSYWVPPVHKLTLGYKDWAAAVEHYSQALLLDPDDQEAKYNLELALQQSEQQQDQEEQQDEQDPQDSSESEESQDENQQSENESGDQSEQDDRPPEDEQNGSENSQEPNEANGQEGDQGEPQDGSQDPENEQQDVQQPGESPAQGQAQERGENQASAVPRLVEGMTAEQAQQLLAAIAGNSETLMERLGQFFYAPSGPPVQDW